MFIESYQNMLKKIINEVLKHSNDYIIIGDNSSGKSDCLKKIILESSKQSYFIDSINRTFDIENIIKTSKKKRENYKNVTKIRLTSKVFNIKDTFDVNGESMGRIEEKYYMYETKLKKMFEEFIGLSFNYNQENISIGVINKVSIGGEIDRISSGYQAVLRIFLELLYLEDSVNIDEPVIVVIDEINEFLSTKYEGLIFPFLKEKFNNIQFVISTHSSDVIAFARNVKIIVIKNNDIEILDGNDYNSITDVREIFKRLFNSSDFKNQEKANVDSELRKLLNAKIFDEWDDGYKHKIESLKSSKLTASQLLIIKQVENWT